MTKILMIEDETTLRQEVMDWLTFEDYEVIGAENGLVGVEYSIRYLPDLIICDITMPALDGYGVLLEVQANPTTANTPFVFTTARASHDDIRKGMAAGADDYITKPYTRLELLRTVQARLEKKLNQEQERQREIDALQASLAEEHEQRQLTAKMVAMFSHDFRNPLTIILMANRMLRDRPDSLTEERRLIHMNRIETSARQLIQMLDDMLVMAQIETGNLDPKVEPLPVAAFIQDIVEDFQEICGEKYDLHFESQFTNTLMIDARLLRQIVANLISNAIKYSPVESKIQVMLNTHEKQYTLIVKDLGIGIPDADLKRLFNTFERGSNVGKIAGTGLGLTIVKRATDLLGGSIHVESTVNIGTTVTVTLPYTVTEH